MTIHPSPLQMEKELLRRITCRRTSERRVRNITGHLNDKH
jgi:hypothetical protein